MAATNTHASSNSFLTSFNTNTTPKLYITAETDSVQEFDQKTLQKWRAEGFQVTYLPYGTGGGAYIESLKSIGRHMSVGDRFGVVAYGDAATACMDTFRSAAVSAKLCCLVAYYPGAVPDPQSSFPIGVRVLVHFAGEEVGVTRTAEVLGIQGKRRTTVKTVPKGTGVGGRLKLAWPSYAYEDAEPGFAEHDLDEFDAINEGIAWSRSLACVGKAFGIEAGIESVWEENCNAKFQTGDIDKLMKTMATKASVNHVPVLTGGVNIADVRRFYDEYFLPDTPPSFEIKLISRTVGSDQIVDELVVNFDHSQEISWILPGVPATNKHVEVALVVIVRVQGGKIVHENTYWDQASVLVQIGLLDPKLIPPELKKLDVHKLPVSGAEAAGKVMNGSSEPSNRLMDDW